MSDLTILIPPGLPGSGDGCNGAKVREIEQAAVCQTVLSPFSNCQREGKMSGNEFQSNMREAFHVWQDE